MSENKIQISEKYKNDVKGLTHDKLILVPLEVIEGLQDFNNWKLFISNPNYIEETSIKIVKEIEKNTKFETDVWDNYSGTHFGY